MIVDAAPGAVGVRSHADIPASTVRTAYAHRTVAGLYHIAGLRADDFSVGVLILNPPQEPVGNNNTVRMLLRGGCGVFVFHFLKVFPAKEDFLEFVLFLSDKFQHHFYL